MASRLTNGQSWRLTILQQNCTLYKAPRLRELIVEYHKTHLREAIKTRPEHESMVQYFEELVILAVSDQIPK